MAFPFDILDLFIPEIANWMAGRSTSDKRRFLRAGVGLLLTGIGIGSATFIFPEGIGEIFVSLYWGYMLGYLFSFCGIGLLFCLFIDKRINS